MQEANEDLSVFDNIIYYLENEGLEYDLLEHDHVHSSEEAAKVRGTSLEEAAKALVLVGKMKSDTSPVTGIGTTNQTVTARGLPPPGMAVGPDWKCYFMCVVSGNKRLDLKKIKELTGFPNVSLASPDKVKELTGLEVGKIPPFPFLFDLDGYVDKGVLENEYVCFSAASNYRSVRMKSDEWRVIASVPAVDIAQEKEE